MRVKLDENLPTSAAQPLRVLGHNVDTVADEGLTGEKDPVVLGEASAAKRLLLTLDRGLGDVRTYPPGSHAGVVVIRVDSQSPRVVTEAVERLAKTVDLNTLAGGVSVWRDGMLRRPPSAANEMRDIPG